MKTVIFAVVAMMAVEVYGQSSLEKMGLIIGPQPKKKSATEIELEKIKQASAEKKAQEKERQEALSDPNNYRTVDGKLYNVQLSDLWETPAGQCKVVHILKDGLVCEFERWHSSEGYYEYEKMIFIKNHPDEKDATRDKILRPRLMMRVGRKEVQGRMLEAYDCGVITGPPAAPPQTEEDMVAAKKVAEEKKAKLASATFKHYEDLAAKGDAYGQFRLAEFYVEGKVVERDLVKARALLEKSSAQGNEDAREILKKLLSESKAAAK